MSEKLKTWLKNPHLDGNSVFWKGGKTGALLIHGFTATTVEVRQLAEFFHQKGLTVSSPLLPGHGTNPHDLNKRKHTEWIECVRDSYLELAGCCTSVIVAGESMGAVLALYTGMMYPEISSLLLYSPAMRVGNLRLARYIRFFKPFIQKTLSKDALPWQGYTVWPLHAANELRKFQGKVRKDLMKITQPVLIFQGEKDRTIDQDSGKYILEKISSGKKKFVYMEKSSHVMLLDKELRKVEKQTWKFLVDHGIV